MKKPASWIIAAALVAGGLAVAPRAAEASSHREAPSIAGDPAADNTDLWAWVKPGTRDTLYIIASYIPFQEPAGGPNFHRFSDEVLYEIHITRGNGLLNDVVTYQIQFKTPPILVVENKPDAPLGGGAEIFGQLSGGLGVGWPKQTYTITKVVPGKQPIVIGKDIPVAPPNAGSRTDSLVLGKTYDDTFAATFITDLDAGEGKAWAGPRDDGFYADLGAIFDLANLRFNKPPLMTNLAVNNLAGYNCHAIALEIPTTLLSANGDIPQGESDANTIGIWASASRRQTRVLLGNGGAFSYGEWTQVSRVGLPLVNEALIGLQDKDKYNRTKPINDYTNFGAYFLSPVLVRDANVVGIYSAYSIMPAAVDDLKMNRTDILDAINLRDVPAVGAHNIPFEPGKTGDVLRVDLGIESSFPNGRPIAGGTQANQEQTDVTDALLSLILTKLAVPPGCGGPNAPGGPKLGDCADSNDKPYLGVFPFLPLPWSGREQGHGKPTIP